MSVWGSPVSTCQMESTTPILSLGILLVAVVIFCAYRVYKDKYKSRGKKRQEVTLPVLDPVPDPIPVHEGLIHLGLLLFEGDFSRTHAAIVDGVPRTVKTFDRIEPQHAAQVRDEQNAMEVLMDHPHRHVVDVLFVRAATIPVFFGYQDVSGFVDLYTITQTHGVLPMPTVRKYVRHVCEGLGHVHALDIIHLDVRPENVLVDNDGLVKLTGFDFSIPRSMGETMRGTPEFMAPEIIVGENFSKQVDWWAVGCLVSEMLTNSSPFVDDSVEKLVRNVFINDIVVPTHANIGPLETTFITALLTRDPTFRLGANGHEEVLGHEWFA